MDHERHYGQGCDDACNDVGCLPHLPLLHRSEETEYQCAAIKIIGAWEVRLKKDPRSLTLGVQDIRQEHGGSEVYCHLHLTVRPDIVSALFRRTTIMDRSDNGKHPASHDIDRCGYAIPVKFIILYHMLKKSNLWQNYFFFLIFGVFLPIFHKIL
jgi:hypothetical protein